MRSIVNETTGETYNSIKEYVEKTGANYRGVMKTLSGERTNYRGDRLRYVDRPKVVVELTSSIYFDTPVEAFDYYGIDHSVGYKLLRGERIAHKGLMFAEVERKLVASFGPFGQF